MDKYTTDLSTVIRDYVMENTYKMVWPSFLVELSVKYPKRKNLYFNYLSLLIFKYY